MLDKYIIQDIIKHAENDWPYESCGLVLENEYMPCENLSPTPSNSFQIDTILYDDLRDKVRFVVHSHNDYPHLTKDDIFMQDLSCKPWCMVNVIQGKVDNLYYWGDTLPIETLIGRHFIHGINDCYTLMRDYYRLKNIVFPRIAADYEWAQNKENHILENYEELGFVPIGLSEVKEGDVLVFKVLSKTPSHIGIFVGKNHFLHHLDDCLSRREAFTASF